VILQACRCIQREGRPLLSAGSVRPSDGCISSKVTSGSCACRISRAYCFQCDMWRRAEDNLLVQNISTKIRLTSYNPDWDVFWNLVAEIPGRLPQQCRARYMPAAFLAQLTWGFLRISVGRVRCAPACVSNDSRSKGRDTATTAYASPPSPAPSPPPPSSLTHVHRCIGYRNPHWQSLPKSARLTYPSVYDSRDRNYEPALFSPPLLAHACTQHTNPHPPHTHAPHVHVHSGPLVSFASDQASCLRRDN
jgi:hypothetical protein